GGVDHAGEGGVVAEPQRRSDPGGEDLQAGGGLGRVRAWRALEVHDLAVGDGERAGEIDDGRVVRRAFDHRVAVEGDVRVQLPAGGEIGPGERAPVGEVGGRHDGVGLEVDRAAEVGELRAGAGGGHALAEPG